MSRASAGTNEKRPGREAGRLLPKGEVENPQGERPEAVLGGFGPLGADLMVETLARLERGEIEPLPQDHALATLAPMLKKEDGRIDWSWTAEEIARRVRGLRPWPVAYTAFRGKTLRIWSAAPAPSPPEFQHTSGPGAIIVQ